MRLVSIAGKTISMVPGSPLYGLFGNLRMRLMSYRRKKTRCPAEKPSCSSCVRLNQSCLYTSIRRGSRGGQSVSIGGSSSWINY